MFGGVAATEGHVASRRLPQPVKARATNTGPPAQQPQAGPERVVRPIPTPYESLGRACLHPHHVGQVRRDGSLNVGAASLARLCPEQERLPV